MAPPVPNIVLFGESGSGKSSIVNMVAMRQVAAFSSGVHGCTFTSACYSINILGSAFNIYDTAGLNEGDAGTVPKQEAIVQLFHLLKSLDTGVSLLVFCMRGPRIKDAVHKNWRLFHEIICCRKVPIVLAITHLEQEPVMDEWWDRNKGAFQDYGMFPQGVACMTATRGKLMRSGAYKLDDEYEESREKMCRLMKIHSLANPWKVQPVEWFTTVVNTTYESRWCRDPIEHRTVKQVVGPGIEALKKQCEMTQAEAEKLGKLLSNA